MSDLQREIYLTNNSDGKIRCFATCCSHVLGYVTYNIFGFKTCIDSHLKCDQGYWT